MTDTTPKIIYTKTDEAPALATASLLPIIEVFASAADVVVETRDISLARRILANLADWLPEHQRANDDLAELGELATRPEANIIKLPNISASVPQLKAAVTELQEKGFALPDYPDEPETDDERAVRRQYDRVKGSAVNPVLREGNSDRRAPRAVKEYARKYPHPMGAWSAGSLTHVATMSHGDFAHNEQSVTVDAGTTVAVNHVAIDGTVTPLRDPIALEAGEIIDATVMEKQALVDFLAEQIDDAAAKGVLFSVHLKATMMKVSDPLIFGHVVKTFFADVFADHAAELDSVDADPNNGLASVLASIADLPADQADAIRADIEATYARRPGVAMVNSDKGISNLHVPSDVIVDASMPAMIRSSGKMWNAAGELQDAKAVIPDSSYAGIYQVVIDDCRAHGAYDPVTMGSVSNVGLMAQKAEEYGSHDKTFEIATAGVVQLVDADGGVLTEHTVAPGDIWRANQVKDSAVRDWVKLAVTRARATGAPAVFWLDAARAHDAQLIAKVRRYLGDHDTDGLTIEIMSPIDATRYSVDRIREGLDTISVTGNVLRDYNTDLFPILEVGTSAKMLSIVPLMNGGGLFETGAGGSAPKHVQQFLAENHLRWDSLGEFLALAVSLEHLAEATGNHRAAVVADALDVATERLLDEGKSPSREVNELDNRGSHFYLALFWATELTAQSDDAELASQFGPLAALLADNETVIVDELNAVQGHPVDIGGYYQPDPALVTAAMRPSVTFNRVLSALDR